MADALGTQTQVLPLEHTDPKSLQPDRQLILVYAIHTFNAPETVKRFARNLPQGRFEKVHIIRVGCYTSWINDASSMDIRKELSAKGYSFGVDQVMAMPLTLVTAFPEDMVQKQISEARETVRVLAKDIQTDAVYQTTISTKAKWLRRLGPVESTAARLWGLELHANKNCIQCGLCERECPEGNIRLTEGGKVKFGFKCIMCIRCVNQCPTQAISPRISKFIPLKGGDDIQRYVNND